MFIDGISVGIGLLFLSLLYLSPAENRPTQLVAGVIAILSWLVSGTLMMEHGGLISRLYIASIPVVFFLLLPLIYWYQQWLTAYGSQSLPDKRFIHWIPVGLAGLLSLSIGLMPDEDFNNMFFNDPEQLSTWVGINSAGFALLLVSWTILSILYLIRIVKNTKTYHLQLNTEFANHEGKRLDWLVVFTSLLVVTWLYALVVLGVSITTPVPAFSETLLSIMVLMLIWIFCLQTLNRKPVFSHIEPEPEPEPEPEREHEQAPEPASEGMSEQKYSNSSIDEARLKRIADKVERKVLEEKAYLNPDIDASTLASELSISVHYLSQVLSQEMQTTFYSYINDARIEAAKDALKSSEKTVLEIALAVGYNTRSSFYNAFKKRTGMTPSRYKASTSSISAAS
ncbi:helix-turn-helix transcriptional regulator [Reinekea blandensis]|uniref:Transcriptional regulator, AraC family protein n=1 Tax=Reinekea blandensis MED297 TaxID=314283 RepID=A4BA08_9GAMM|nr:helix-turn-helix transcriptional regulator [Reinekea blandensis]EAR11459.1 transcriptional regulator, AraC family protein [Reinekea sp. MED297] [Reinekea blandensis MED297]